MDNSNKKLGNCVERSDSVDCQSARGSEGSDYIINHRHCQATILSAYGPTGDGKSKDYIDHLDLPYLYDSNWKSHFSGNTQNITQDFKAVLELLNNTSGNLNQRIQEQGKRIDGVKNRNITLTLSILSDETTTKQFKFGTTSAISGENFNIEIPLDNKVGDGLYKSDGKFMLKTATGTTLGGVKIGSDLSIDGNGQITVKPGKYISTQDTTSQTFKCPLFLSQSPDTDANAHQIVDAAWVRGTI